MTDTLTLIESKLSKMPPHARGRQFAEDLLKQLRTAQLRHEVAWLAKIGAELEGEIVRAVDDELRGAA
jgi:hypothetical protein